MIRKINPNVGHTPRAWLALILIILLGLICACSPDPQPAEDTWRLTEPYIERSQAKSTLRLSQTTAEFADLDDRLVFDPQNAADQLSGEARCITSSGEELTAPLTGPVTDQLRALSLARLIPDSFLQNLARDNSAAKEWTCSWRLRVTNASGSAHSFRIPAQRLQLRDLHADASRIVERVALLCPSWSAQIERPRHLATAIAELPRLDQVQGSDDRHLIRQGQCLLVTDLADGRRGLTLRHSWQLPPPAIEVQVEATGSYQPTTRPLTEVFRINVTNHEAHAVWIEYKSHFQARILGESQSAPGVWSASLHTPIDVQSEPTPSKIMIGDRHRVKLEAKSGMQLRWVVRRTMFCQGSLARRIGVMLKDSESWGLNWVEHASPEVPIARPTRPIGPQLELGSLWTRAFAGNAMMALPQPPTTRQAPCLDREMNSASVITRSDD
ncbi:MAG TPA: hypothetical protein PLZ57_09705 [Pseudobdellovibrionaceae bacterium]|nr:hypothetical protein [Pseudobdellovibrionaceae bacterium]